ncbi:ABC transporter permease [Sanguibacter gelidistatuariae]|nr:ABC transporter permease [Sanguibacter gelidistatuariae]
MNGSLRWLRRTALRVVPVVTGVVLATFFLLRLVPGGPAAAALGDQATNEAVAALEAQMGLDQPLMTQLWSYVSGIVTRGDVGTSLLYGTPTSELIAGRVGVTLSVVALAVLLTLVLVVPLAFAAALHKDGVVDHLIRVVPAIGLAMPTFWIGLLLIMVFAVNLGWLPAGGSGDGVRSLILPAVAIAISMTPVLVRTLRAQLLEVLDADFVATLTAAGLARGRVLVHVLRNAALPTLTLFGLNIAYMIGGTLVIERVFALNGLGALMFESISNRDFPVVQGVALFCAVAVVAVTVATDFLVDRLDPRSRLS